MTDDRRHIDPALGSLGGEGAAQRVRGGEPPISFEVWDKTPSEASERTTYYERPVIKEPVWIWAVPVYFWAGGAAGAAATLGAAAQALDGDALRGLVGACRRIAATGTIAGTGLLIYDLGRPERFLNMLRVFRATSPLSVGSWILAGATSLSAVSASLFGSTGARRTLGDLAGYGAGVAGVPLAGYTAVLLSSTVIPAWREARRSLPVLFVAAATSSASSLLDLTELDARERRVTDTFGFIGGIAEIAAAAAVRRDLSRVEAVGRTLEQGVSGILWRAATGLAVASLGLSWIGRKSRAGRVASGLLGAAGGLAMRFAVYHAGKASARDPAATFDANGGWLTP